MRKFYYYAKLNDNNVCVEIQSKVDKIPNNTDGYIELPEYNETVRYRKWLGNQWSQETYEPSVDTVLQDKIKGLEEELQMSSEKNERLKNKVTELEGTILELTSIISSLQGGN